MSSSPALDRFEIPGESPDSINEAIQEVLLLIEAMDPTTNTACKLAQKQDPHLLTNNQFLLRFLRAAMYDTGDCAKRVVAYFEQKKQLFGAKRLCKPVTIADLDEADRKCLRSSIMQLLPGRDRAGRAILLWNACLQSGHSCLSQQRVQFYGLQDGSEPLEVQHCGLIVVFWNHGPGRLPVSELEGVFQEVSESLIGVPQIRCEAFHCCIDLEDDDVRISSALMRLASNFSRVNVRCHSGSVAEIGSSLKTFGIPVHLLPVTGDESSSAHTGTTITGSQCKSDASILLNLGISPSMANSDDSCCSGDSTSLEVTYQGDASTPIVLPCQMPKNDPLQDQSSTCSKQTLPVELPSYVPAHSMVDDNDVPIVHCSATDNDVVLGKGRLIQNFPGNVRFRGLIVSYFDQYENAENAQDKTLLAMRIVADITDNGGKFLKEHPAGSGRYIEADFQVAREKVSSTFHSYRRRTKRKYERIRKSHPTDASELFTSKTSKRAHIMCGTDSLRRPLFLPGSADTSIKVDSGLVTRNIFPPLIAHQTPDRSQELRSQIRTSFSLAHIMAGRLLDELSMNNIVHNPLCRGQTPDVQVQNQTQRLSVTSDSMPKTTGANYYREMIPSTSIPSASAYANGHSAVSLLLTTNDNRLRRLPSSTTHSVNSGMLPKKALPVIEIQDDTSDDSTSASSTMYPKYRSQEFLQAQLYHEMGLPGF